MANTTQPLMTADEFLLWCLDQQERYELVDGVPLEMMTGSSNRHDKIVVNFIIALGLQLRGTPCRPATADIALRTKRRSVRRPDVTITCDPASPTTYDVESARLVVEVLSPSNRGIDWQRKLEEYRHRDGLSYILLVESEKVGAILLHRDAAAGAQPVAWNTTDFDDLDGIIERPFIGCRLAMADVYDGAFA